MCLPCACVYVFVVSLRHHHQARERHLATLASQSQPASHQAAVTASHHTTAKQELVHHTEKHTNNTSSHHHPRIQHIQPTNHTQSLRSCRARLRRRRRLRRSSSKHIVFAPNTKHPPCDTSSISVVVVWVRPHKIPSHRSTDYQHPAPSQTSPPIQLRPVPGKKNNTNPPAHHNNRQNVN